MGNNKIRRYINRSVIILTGIIILKTWGYIKLNLYKPLYINPPINKYGKERGFTINRKVQHRKSHAIPFYLYSARFAINAHSNQVYFHRRHFNYKNVLPSRPVSGWLRTRPLISPAMKVMRTSRAIYTAPQIYGTWSRRRAGHAIGYRNHDVIVARCVTIS